MILASILYLFIYLINNNLCNFSILEFWVRHDLNFKIRKTHYLITNLDVKKSYIFLKIIVFKKYFTSSLFDFIMGFV